MSPFTCIICTHTHKHTHGHIQLPNTQTGCRCSDKTKTMSTQITTTRPPTSLQGHEVCGWFACPPAAVLLACERLLSCARLKFTKLTTVGSGELVPLSPGGANPKERVLGDGGSVGPGASAPGSRCLLAEADPDNSPGRTLSRPLQRVPAPRAGSPALRCLETR